MYNTWYFFICISIFRYLQLEKIKYRNYDRSLAALEKHTLVGYRTRQAPSGQHRLLVGKQRRNVRGRVDIAVSSSGIVPLFSRNRGADLVDRVKYGKKNSYGYSLLDFRHIDTDLATSLNKRKIIKRLTEHWVHHFLKRWPDLKLINLAYLNGSEQSLPRRNP